MLIVSVLGFFVVIFLVAIITAAIAWMGFLKRAAEAEQAARGEQEEGDSPDILEAESELFRNDRLSSLSFWDNVLARFDFVEILKTRLAQADLSWSVGRVTLAMLLCGSVVFLLFSNFMGAWVSLLAGAAAAFAPYGYVLRLREKRFNKFRDIFPDVLDSLSRALRAGYPMSAALDAVAGEVDEPVASEMKKVAVEANLGMGWERALENLGHRIPLLEVNLFGAAVVLHSRTGGKLSEVMDGVATSMREAVALRGEVRSLAAHGKLTGAILTLLPIGIAGMMMVVSPSYMLILYNHPWGKTFIMGAIGLLILAHFVIRRMVDIKV